MKHLLVAIPFVLVFLFLPVEALAVGETWYGAFVYGFQHSNIFHLIGNMLVFVPLVHVMRERFLFDYWRILLVPYLCSVFAGLAYTGEPVVGSSGMIYALIGIYYASAVGGYHMKVRRKKKFTIWFVVALLSMVVPSFFGGVSLFIHLASWVAGSVYAFVNAAFYNVLKRGYN
jgi:membrane associated rhomboid family serine protease